VGRITNGEARVMVGFMVHADPEKISTSVIVAITTDGEVRVNSTARCRNGAHSNLETMSILSQAMYSISLAGYEQMECDHENQA